MAVVCTVAANVLGKTEVAFDSHAIKRMAERGVTEAEVLLTLAGPDQTGLRADPGRLRVRRRFGSKRTVDVVYEEEPTRIVVITVWARNS